MKWKRIVCLGMAAVLVCSGLPPMEAYGQEISEETGSIAENEEDFAGAVSRDTDTYILYGLKNPSEEITEVRIPETIQGKNVTVIGDGSNARAFKECPNLKKITFPANLECIEDGAFKQCENLEEIIFQGGLRIEEDAFMECAKLTKVTLPESLEELEQGAFQNCVSLKEIALPGTLGKVENYTFASCTGLEKVTIGEGITSIGQFAFNACESLTTVELPESLEEIETCVFQGCTSLTEIELPDALKILGDQAFHDTNLAEVTLPLGIEVPARNPFSYCSNLSEFKMEGEGSYSIVEDGIWYKKNKETLLSYPGKKEGDYEVPDTVTGFIPMAFWAAMDW